MNVLLVTFLGQYTNVLFTVNIRKYLECSEPILIMLFVIAMKLNGHGVVAKDVFYCKAMPMHLLSPR